jgi:hypothetical protein
MKRLQILLLVGILFNHGALMAATNPFEEGEIKIEQATSGSSVEADEKIVQTAEVTISKADLDKAIAKLQEANENYSRLKIPISLAMKKVIIENLSNSSS